MVELNNSELTEQLGASSVPLNEVINAQIGVKE